MPAASKPRLILVKRYARSRLYDTTHNRYVSVEELRGWLAKRVAFCVDRRRGRGGHHAHSVGLTARRKQSEKGANLDLMSRHI